MTSFLAGLALGLSLIIAIGAQNVFLLRQGLRREHVLPIVLVCALSDAVLIVIGVAGLGYLVERAPWVLVVARWAGGLFLIAYGLLAARRAWRPAEQGLVAEGRRDAPRPRLRPALLTALALTWLNPHVYLDTVLTLGAIAATHGDARWGFAAGAVLASFVWFSALGFGARGLGRWLSTPRSWRILDAGIAVVMIGLGIALILPALR